VSATTVVSERNNALLEWYAAEERDLPWRRAHDPYLTLVSESMLQQTQVDRVIPKFEQFIQEWPSIADLAAADSENVLDIWSGLGYNSRALRLRAAAVEIDANGWPTTLEGLQRLPGVGAYTAAAIASIAFGEDVPAVDTNLRRVLSRWAGEPLIGSDLIAASFEMVGTPAGDWNQAVMDLGSGICRPREPHCSLCPVQAWCSDPNIYEAPPRQSRFKGSNRELRGALVRAGLAKTDPHEAGRSLGREHAEIVETLDRLRAEGLIG
jgi:A/G-specific adenine glycosylase